VNLQFSSASVGPLERVCGNRLHRVSGHFEIANDELRQGALGQRRVAEDMYKNRVKKKSKKTSTD
jgi:hypothetical protein